MNRLLGRCRPFAAALYGCVLNKHASADTVQHAQDNQPSSSSSSSSYSSLNSRVYRKSEVSQHKTLSTGVWVTHEDGVYDITRFIVNHPGGADKIMLAAGGAIDPFWNLYKQHYNSKLPAEILSSLCIGSLHPDDVPQTQDIDQSDPYSLDPIISPLLAIHQNKPANAECSCTLLTDSWITPEDLWFVRNHHPVPAIDSEAFTLSIKGLHTQKHDEPATVSQLKSKYAYHEVVSSLQCGGNRRSEMTSAGGTLGTQWGVAAIGTARWGGVKLRDVIMDGMTREFSVDELDNWHVCFTSADGLTASIPLHKAVDARGDVLLAWNMNGKPLSAIHGGPLRVIVPGHVGVRNVKWVTESTPHIRLATLSIFKGSDPQFARWRESTSPAYSNIMIRYPNTLMLTIDPESPGAAGSVGHHCSPQRGFAYSGGGRGIVRVDVSADGGATWVTAHLLDGSEQPRGRAWAWTLWEADIPIDDDGGGNGGRELICKATDEAYNVQPESVRGIWNLRGINNNAWHRVVVDVKREEDEEEEETED